MESGFSPIDTHDYRYGGSVGGPIVTNRTFFFANYEGSRLKALGGGSQAIVPTAAMRAGDFSANNEGFSVGRVVRLGVRMRF